MWSDTAKDRFFDAVKDAVSCGAQPDEMIHELEQGYYLALDDLKKAACYSFGVALNRK